MTKFFLLCMFLILSTFLAVGEMLVSQPPEEKFSMSLVELRDYTNKVDQNVSKHRQFSDTLYATVADLAEEKISLQDAIVQVHHSSEDMYPIFLHMLSLYNPGQTVRENVAHNIIDHLQNLAGEKPNYHQRVSALELELQEILDDESWSLAT